MHENDLWHQKKSRLKFNFDKADALVVDANALALDVLTGILSGFGFRRLNRFTDIRKAERFLEQTPVDIIFVDPYAFGPDGFSFVKGVRDGRFGENASAPVFAVTGHAFLRAVTEMRTAGADYLIAKPFSPTILLDRIIWVAASRDRQAAQAAEAASSNLVLADETGVANWQ